MAFETNLLPQNIGVLILGQTGEVFNPGQWLLNAEWHYKPDRDNPDYIGIIPKGKTAIATTPVAYMDLSNSAKTTFVYTAQITQWNALP